MQMRAILEEKVIPAKEDKALPIKEEKAPLANVTLYLDFDGTLTDREGSQCVYSDLYRSLQTDKNVSYSDCIFKDNMVELLKEGFKQADNATMRMTKGGVDFLNHMLASGAHINIVSRNRKEYIQAVLLVEGVKAELVQENIKIYDVNDLTSGKYGVVANLHTNSTAEVAVVADDNPKDCKAMENAIEVENATKDSGPKTAVLSYVAKPGTFDWPKIEADTRAKVNELAPKEKIPLPFFAGQKQSADSVAVDAVAEKMNSLVMS